VKRHSVAGIAVVLFALSGCLEGARSGAASCPMAERRFRELEPSPGVGEGVEGAGHLADHDNDGYTDLYVTGFGRNTLYRNNGDGT
jgi:hypothetical protein